jgi:4-amino-4-deoxy-L-arabinose transferase-like glycosyltransferase
MKSIGVLLLAVLAFVGFSPQLSKPLMMLSMAALAILVVVFIIFIFREQPRDEREVLHSLKGGQVSYLLGAIILVVGIVSESFAHNLDPYLPLTLGIMIFAKLVSTRSIQ